MKINTSINIGIDINIIIDIKKLQRMIPAAHLCPLQSQLSYVSHGFAQIHHTVEQS